MGAAADTISSMWQTIARPLDQQINRKPEQPPAIIVMPAAATSDTATSDTANADASGNAAADAQRKKAKGAQGISEDKKTGSQGLGEVPATNMERKTLLGY